MKTGKLISYLVLALFCFTAADSHAIKIKIKGAGGMVQNGDDVDICPLKSRELCAVIECSFWDCVEYLLGLEADDGTGGSNGGNGNATANLVMLNNGSPVTVYKVQITSLPADALTAGQEEGISGSRVKVKMASEAAAIGF